MHDFTTFFFQNWYYFTALILLFILLMIEENNGATPGALLNSQSAVQLINKSDTVVMDVRNQESFQTGHLINAVNHPADSIDLGSKAILALKNKPILLVDQQQKQATKLYSQLKKAGFTQLHILKGGIDAWTSANMPVIKTSKEG